MHHYNHLTLLEREKILYFLAKGYKIAQIAKKLGRNKSTISREIRRNSHNEEYMPVTAQDQYLCRRSKCRRHKKMDDVALINLIKNAFFNSNGHWNKFLKESHWSMTNASSAIQQFTVQSMPVI